MATDEITIRCSEDELTEKLTAVMDAIEAAVRSPRNKGAVGLMDLNAKFGELASFIQRKVEAENPLLPAAEKD